MPSAPARFRWRHARSSGTARAAWLAPAAAATAMIVIAVSVVAVSRNTRMTAGPPEPGRSAPGRLTAGPPVSTYVTAGRVPPYYVAITSHGNPNLNPSYAVVQETASGSQPLARPTCQQDSIITPDGSAIVCAAVAVTNEQESTPASGGVSLRRGAVTAFYEYSAVAGTLLRALGHWSFGNVGALAVDVLWSNPSGTVLIAMIPTAGDGRVGIISGNQFTPLKARSASVSPDSGTW